MSLIVHVGVPGSGACDAVVDTWWDRGGWLVVGDEAAGTRAMLERLGPDGGSWDRETMTAGRLVDRARDLVGVAPWPEPAPLTLRIAIAEALDAGRPWAGLGRSVDGPGAAAVVERTLRELHAAKIDGETLRAVASATAITLDLATLLDAVAEPLAEVGGPGWLVAEALAAGRSLRRSPLGVHVGDASRLTVADTAVVVGLAGRGVPVTAALPSAPGHDAPLYGERLAAAATQTIRHRDPRPGTSARSHLLAKMFRPGAPEPPTPDTSVRFLTAAGTRAAHRLAAEDLLDGDPALTDLVAVLPRLDDDASDLADLLAEWQVPHERNARLAFTETPIGAALAGLWHFATLPIDDPHERLDAVLLWLRSPYSGAAADDVDRYEAKQRRLRNEIDKPGQLLKLWDDVVKAPAVRLLGARRAGLATMLSNLLAIGHEGLARADANRREANGAAGPWALTGADHRDLAALAALGGLARRARGSATDDDVAEQLASHTDRPDDEAGAGGRRPLAAVTGPLAVLLTELPVHVRVGRDGGGIAMRPPDGLGIRGARRVAVLGLEADVLPRRRPPAPLLPDDLRSVLGLPRRRGGPLDDRLAFLQAVAAAGESVHLVRRTADDDGRPVGPSPFWVEACRVLGRAIDGADMTLDPLGALLPAQPRTLAEVDRGLAAHGTIVGPALERAARARRRSVGLSAGRLAGRRRFPVTDLETYLGCHYGWLYSRMLRPSELEQPFDARAEGSMMHQIMKRVVDAVTRVHGTAVPCDAGHLATYLDALPAAVATVGDEVRPAGAGRGFAALVRRVEAQLALALRQEAEIKPVFSPRFVEHDVAASIAAGTEVYGRADRIDVGPQGDVVVVDYKRSGGEIDDPTDLRVAATRLQLAVYAEAAAARTPGAVAAGGRYITLKGGPNGTRNRPAGVGRASRAPWDATAGLPLVDDDAWDAQHSRALDAARAAVAGIRRGTLEAPTCACDGETDRLGRPRCPHRELWR